ncbi:hypothetical protein [Sphingobium boeckii]|uniref:DUF4136 domain-containing protein n=1 Tax=Sphingobium boeckii TaxID=1082345 RepID=A0A7W9ECH4_9SPHN|nr:hypothetical protein [Sphingobium boeckii]MBB5684273.1 hypothetical protein [Sphingobium boeckii]
MNIKAIAGTLLAFSLAGCVQPLRVETSASGAPIPAGSHYVWLLPEAEQPHLPEASRLRMADALAAKGLIPAAAGGKADYLLLVNQARRPAKVGLAALDPPPVPGAEPAWLARPGKRGKQLSTLELRFLDPATGHEVSVLSARASHGKRDEPVVLDRLIESVSRQPPTP